MLVNFCLTQFVPGGPIEQILSELEGKGDVFESISGSASETIETRIEFITNGVVALKIGDVPGVLLQEDTDRILQENDSRIMLEQV